MEQQKSNQPVVQDFLARVPKSHLAEQLASQAEFIVNHLQQTDYQYTEYIDVPDGVYDCDCSSFVSFVLQGVVPRHYAMVPVETDRPRPRAFEYYLFFSSLTPESTNGWHRIDFLRDVRRGDIVAWRFPEIRPGQDTGHVFFVAAEPTMIDSDLFAVRVYDSAAGPHFDDTRGTGKGKFPNGVGSGILKLRVDDTGTPIAFQFGPSAPFVTLPISIGRVEPLPAT